MCVCECIDINIDYNKKTYSLEKRITKDKIKPSMKAILPYFFLAQPLNQLWIFAVSWVQKARKAQ